MQVGLAGQAGKAPVGQEVREAGRPDALDTAGADARVPAPEPSPSKPPPAAKPSGTAAGSMHSIAFVPCSRYQTSALVPNVQFVVLWTH